MEEPNKNLEEVVSNNYDASEKETRIKGIDFIPIAGYLFYSNRAEPSKLKEFNILMERVSQNKTALLCYNAYLAGLLTGLVW